MGHGHAEGINSTVVKSLVCVLAVGVFWFQSDVLQSASNGFSMDPHNVPLEEIQAGGPPKDGIPALMNPKFVSADEVDFLSDEDRILGIQGQTQAKAYPLAILNWHELVNDTLEGKPVLISYCPLCGSGVGFLRTVKGRVLTFGVSGLLFQSDVLMYDYQTESLWSQLSTQAVTGPMTGHRLKPIFLEHTTWEAWRQKYPQTVVLSTDTGFTRDYQRDPYAGYARSDRIMFPVSHMDNRYPPKEWVLGVEVNGHFKAYPFSELEPIGIPFADTLNGKQFVVCWDPTHRSSTVIDPQGTPLPAIMAYWFAWSAFHPDTTVFTSIPPQNSTAMKHLAGLCS